MSLPPPLSTQWANALQGAPIPKRGLVWEGFSTRSMQRGVAVKKLPTGLVKGKVFTVDKGEKTARGIWESSEHREKEVG